MIRIVKAEEYKYKEDSEEFFPDQIYNFVRDTAESIKKDGDRALKEYIKKYDGAVVEKIIFSIDELQMPDNVPEKFIKAVNKAKQNIINYHKKQMKNSWFDTTPKGSVIGQKITPLGRVGVYVPGGRAAYPSTVLMTVLPAKIAGVKEVIMATPPDALGNINPYTLYAAKEAGADKILLAGGAHGICALAYGTESVPKVDKIVGPGNKYVTLAKKHVFGVVDIDMLAGPSEVLIVADNTANPRFVAADLISQAEHDPDARCFLITQDIKLAYEVKEIVLEMVEQLSRKDIIKSSLKNNGFIIITSSEEETIKLINNIAPEHLEIMTKKPFENLGKIKNAGAVFLGNYSPEPLGDYYAGPNHVLPTSGTARFNSVLSIDDFIKRTSIIYYSQKDFAEAVENVCVLADSEGLDAHKNSILVRGEKLNGN